MVNNNTTIPKAMRKTNETVQVKQRERKRQRERERKAERNCAIARWSLRFFALCNFYRSRSSLLFLPVARPTASTFFFLFFKSDICLRQTIQRCLKKCRRKKEKNDGEIQARNLQDIDNYLVLLFLFVWPWTKINDIHHLKTRTKPIVSLFFLSSFLVLRSTPTHLSMTLVKNRCLEFLQIHSNDHNSSVFAYRFISK